MHDSLESIASAWSLAPLSNGWTTLVETSFSTLSDQATPVETAGAWQQLAMLFGDTGAPELCAVVALAALADPGDHGPTLRSHANLALLDLGLAHAGIPDEPIRLIELDTAITPDPGGLETWLATFLAPVGGMTEGAQLCLRLAAIRAGLRPRPDPFTLAAVSAIDL